MDATKRAYLELHFAVFLYGFAAIFGALISISAVAMVWWRLLLSLVILALYIPIYKELSRLGKKQMLTFLFIGGIIGLHWITFYGSIKLANASVALICFSAAPFFTSFIEPMVTKSKRNNTDIIFGIVIIPAMYLILSSLDISMIWGAVSGILSALLAALFNSLNKKYISDLEPVSLFTIEIAGALILLSLIIPFIHWNDIASFIPVGMDWIYLLGLVIFVTILGFILHLRSLKYISAFTSNFVISLEPVYGIILAILILNEHRQLTFKFYVGVVIITLLVLIYPTINRKYQDRST